MQYVCLWSPYPQYTMLLCDGVAHVEGDERLPEIPKINQVNMFQSKEHSVFSESHITHQGKVESITFKVVLCVAYVPKVYKIVFQCD